MLAITAAVLIAISLLVETLGFYLRFAGARMRMPSLGYSLHVQAATLSRFGTLIGLPLIGWLIDNGAEIREILVIPIWTFGIFSIVNFAAAFYMELGEAVARVVFRKLAGSMHGVDERVVDRVDGYSLAPSHKLRLYTAGTLSFFLAASGFFLAAVFATIYFDYRATILQMSPVVTAFGTLISVVLFDPRISYHIDNGAEQRDVMRVILLSRALGGLSLAVLSAAWMMYV